MSLNVKDQIICLLKENHSDWNDSIDINDYDVIVPMLESFHQYELINEYVQLLEDDSKLDLDQKLSQAGLKMASQKLNKNQHQLPSDKIRRIEKSLEKLQQEEVDLRKEINSQELLAKGKTAEEQATIFDAVVNLRADLKRITTKVQELQKEKASLVTDIDNKQVADKPEYKRTQSGAHRKSLSTDELNDLQASVTALQQQRETVDGHLEKLQTFFANGNPVVQKLSEITQTIANLSRNLKTYKQSLSDAEYTLGNPGIDVKEKDKAEAQKAVAALPGIISSTEQELKAAEDKKQTLLASADERTRNAIDALSKTHRLKADIESQLESKSSLLQLDSPGQKVDSEPVKVVGKDPLVKQSNMTQFKEKLNELSRNFNSLLANAERNVQSGSSPYSTVGADLMHQVRAFYGDQPESVDGKEGVRFKNNARIGNGRDIINQLVAFINNELSKGTDRESRTLYQVGSKNKFSTERMPASKAFINDIVTLNNLLQEIKDVASSNNQNLHIGREFNQYIDTTLSELNKFKDLTSDLKKEFADRGYTATERDIDETTVNAEMSKFNSESLIKSLSLLNTFGAIPEVGKYPQLVAHIKYKIEQISQSKNLTKIYDAINELVTQVTSAVPTTETDDKVKSVKSLLSAVNTNRQITKFRHSLESDGQYYIMPNNAKVSKGNVNRITNKYRNGKGSYSDFYREVLENAVKSPVEKEDRGDKIEPIIKSAKVPEYNLQGKDKNWNKLSIKK